MDENEHPLEPISRELSLLVSRLMVSDETDADMGRALAKEAETWARRVHDAGGSWAGELAVEARLVIKGYDQGRAAGLCFNRLKHVLACSVERLDDAMGVEVKKSAIPSATPDVPREKAAAGWYEILPGRDDETFYQDFIHEAPDHLQSIEMGLLAMTRGKDWDGMSVYRPFHTLKGLFGFMGQQDLKELCHGAESMMEPYKTGASVPSRLEVDLILKVLDLLQEQIRKIAVGLPNGKFELVDTRTLLAQIRAKAGVRNGVPPEEEAVKRNPGDDSPEGAPAAPKAGGGNSSAMDGTVRIRTERLDSLIDMIGELVIAHSMVSQDESIRNSQFYDLIKKISHTSKIVRDLQDISLSLRMVPLKALFQRMARLTHDQAGALGKEVRIELYGEDIEIDRNMVETVSAPLVHLIRNALDHGLEDAGQRAEAGKPKAGLVRLEARRAEGNIHIEVRDDGRGLDRSRIIDKARRQGLIADGESFSDEQVFNLIFEAGFSTTEKVTDVSGRGVGLDVVKKGVESLKGRIDVSSAPGRGCSFTLKVPLTMAITDGILLKVEDQRFILPTPSIQITVKPHPDQVSTVEGRGEMFLFKGSILPVVRLQRLFAIGGYEKELTDGLLVIIGEGERRCALFVDELLGQSQVVTKNMGDNLGAIPGISGGAILGDGRVGLILDPQGLMLIARQGTRPVRVGARSN